MFNDAFSNKKVWLSGHTGFKGSWLAEWLHLLGAEVHGYALPPESNPALFEQLGLERRLTHEVRDVRSAEDVKASILRFQPDFVFHLAAQPLVRDSYAFPVETYNVNVLGTIHVLEALRKLEKPCAAVFVTTDKCYENREWVHGYRENDPLGGFDPYSSSKAAAEIAISSWRRSFFSNHPVNMASVRAGNVIGGGDWAKDRIIPDCIRALQAGAAIPIRNKTSTRPWQHVLEPLSGYLWLAALLANPQAGRHGIKHYASTYNFGPEHEANRTVAELVEHVLQHWPGRWTDQSDPNAVHEAKLLQLSTDKAHALLDWKPVWDFAETVEKTTTWYRSVTESTSPGTARKKTLEQIREYTARAGARNIRWAIQ